MVSNSALKGLNDDGTLPESRLTDATDVYNLITKLIDDDDRRAKVRATTKGLFDGNPPFRYSDLVKAGQAYRNNVNWRIAEAMLTTSLTSYWDVVSEGPSMATCITAEGDDDDRQEWSNIITDEFQKFNLADTDLNYMFQTSQYYMVLFGVGPVIWENELDYKARAVENVLVPDGEYSNVNMWEVCVVPTEYSADKLYSYIRNEKAAESMGWNVEFVKEVLVNSFPKGRWPQGRYDRWDWLQRKLRNNDIAYSSVCQKTRICHVYYREFPTNGESEGRISHCIIESETKGPQFLFRKLKRYANWREVIAPFYYDIGDGTHHSVKGLGIKAYGALESYNRLQCSIVDSAHFGSAIHVQSTTENVRQNASVVEMGPYKVWPAGFNIVPTASLGQMLDGPMVVKQDLLNTVTSNLSQYRQGLSRQKGNPITATEASWRAENETVLSRTQLTRYFDQLDEFWAERYRRVSSKKALSQEAKDFQKKCMDRGVPREALDNMESVRATRTVGYGSPYNRQQAFNYMLQLMSLMPETGRRRLMEDLTSSYVGASLMRRYIPKEDDLLTNERAFASLQIAAAKQGIAPVIPEGVSNELFATMFIDAAEQAANSLAQGANPLEVVTFIETIGPAIYGHINKLKEDKSKQAVAKELENRAKEVASMTDNIRRKVNQMMQQRAQNAQTQNQASRISAGVDPDTQLKAAETQAKLEMQAAKTQQQMRLREESHQQKMRINATESAQ